MSADAGEDYRQLGRLGEVGGLVGTAIYLLSPASDFCTGQVMYVDGRYTTG